MAFISAEEQLQGAVISRSHTLGAVDPVSRGVSATGMQGTKQTPAWGVGCPIWFRKGCACAQAPTTTMTQRDARDNADTHRVSLGLEWVLPCAAGRQSVGRGRGADDRDDAARRAARLPGGAARAGRRGGPVRLPDARGRVRILPRARVPAGTPSHLVPGLGFRGCVEVVHFDSLTPEAVSAYCHERGFLQARPRTGAWAALHVAERFVTQRGWRAPVKIPRKPGHARTQHAGWVGICSPHAGVVRWGCDTCMLVTYTRSLLVSHAQV